ncbi:histone-lysine N-trimethyltransferase SMYD5-like [Sycon ciliatum]|uniref:histone-lysine N-trimethyltransferase SMYD5-like n=1 Tax=Sycon ciliatum TaxID=27933 RepID=UPI0031F61434
MATAGIAGLCGPSFEESGLSIEEVAGRGRAIIAKRPFKEDETLFIESPLMSCQFSWNREYKYLACEYCLRSLETAEEMACRLSSQPSIDLPLSADCCESKPSTYVKCPDCEVQYCSAPCQQMAAERYHRGVCEGRMDAQRRELFSELKETWRNMHYPPETTNIEVLARCFSAPAESPYGQHLFQQLELLVHGTTSEDEEFQHKLLQPDYAVSLLKLCMVPLTVL